MQIELPGEMFCRPVESDEDVFAFRYDFVPEGKALEDGSHEQVVTELENGDLLIKGYAAVWEGTDREGENFMPGAFERGIKSFLGSQAALCFHHKADHGIGKVLDLKEDGKGLAIEARVDKQVPSSPLYYIYNAIKKGTYNGLSVGGFFRRKLTEAGQKIADMDFTEISVTPVPIHPGTSLNVVAGKALQDITLPRKPKKSSLEGDIRQEDEMALAEIAGMWNRILDGIERRGSGSKGTFGGEPVL